MAKKRKKHATGMHYGGGHDGTHSPTTKINHPGHGSVMPPETMHSSGDDVTIHGGHSGTNDTYTHDGHHTGSNAGFHDDELPHPMDDCY